MSNKNYNKYFEKKEKEPVQLSLDDVAETPVEEPVVEETEEVVEEVTDVIETPVEETEEPVVEETEEEAEEPVVEETEPIQNDQKVKVITGKLNIREKANKESKVVTIVNEGEKLTLLENNVVDGFYHVATSNGFEGYCMENFVELV